MSTAQIDIIKGRWYLQSGTLAIVETCIRIFILPLQLMTLTPLLFVLHNIGIIPRNKAPLPNQMRNNYIKLALSSPIWLPYTLITLCTLDIIVFPIDYILYKIECEEWTYNASNKQTKEIKGVRHSYETWLTSRYVQSMLCSPFYNLRKSKSLTDAFVNYQKCYLTKALPKKTDPKSRDIITLIGRPHRQFNERIDNPNDHASNHEIFGDAFFGAKFNVKAPVTSVFEGNGANAAQFENVNECADFMEAKHGEFCHIHTFDGSWHCVLSPGDAIRVIEAGWGEIWPNYLIYPNVYKVPYLLLFACKTDEDIQVLKQILTASYKFCSDKRALK